MKKIKVRYKPKRTSGLSHREFSQRGGFGRARSMTPEERREASRRAGQASAGIPRPGRWKMTPNDRIKALMAERDEINAQIEIVRKASE